jgi:hypothetical protein
MHNTDYFLSQFYETYFTNGEKHFLCHDDVYSKKVEALHEPNKINASEKYCNSSRCYLKAAFLLHIHVVVKMKKIIRSVKFYLNKHKPIDINFW